MTDITKRDIDNQLGPNPEAVAQLIVSWRIYDALLVILDTLGGDSGRLAALHEQGIFLGPDPSYAGPDDDEGPIDLAADQPEPGR